MGLMIQVYKTYCIHILYTYCIYIYYIYIFAIIVDISEIRVLNTLIR